MGAIENCQDGVDLNNSMLHEIDENFIKSRTPIMKLNKSIS